MEDLDKGSSGKQQKQDAAWWLADAGSGCGRWLREVVAGGCWLLFLQSLFLLLGPYGVYTAHHMALLMRCSFSGSCSERSRVMNAPLSWALLQRAFSRSPTTRCAAQRPQHVGVSVTRIC